MKLVLFLTLCYGAMIIMGAAVMLASCRCASNADKSIRNMRRNRLRKFLAASKALR